MIELGELEGKHQDFAARHVKVIVISNDDQPTAKATQDDFKHLVVVSDADQAMARAIQVIHAGAGRFQDDTNAPTTFLVDGGSVKWFFRPAQFITRLPADDLLAAIDRTWPKSQ